MRATTVLVTTLLFWGCGALAEEPSQHDVQAAQALSTLVQLEEGPRVLVESCKTVDPGGAQKRQAAYAGWKHQHRALFEKIDAYTQDILPALFASVAQKNADTSVLFRSKQSEGARQEIAALPAGEREKLCKNFAGAAFFNEDRTANVTKAAFDVLDAWKKERGEGAA